MASKDTFVRKGLGLVLVPALLLAGCGAGRDEVLSEKVAAAQAAADRAVRAAEAAEAAATAAGAKITPTTFEDDGDSEADADAVEENEDFDDPDSGAFDNTMAPATPAPTAAAAVTP